MTPNMTEQQQCTRCLHKLDLTMFSMNFRGENYKRCNNCIEQAHGYRQKDTAKECYKKHYENNKEKINEKSRQWERDNKDRLNEKVTCENCGAITNRNARSRHKHTIKCKEFNNTKFGFVLLYY